MVVNKINLDKKHRTINVFIQRYFFFMYNDVYRYKECDIYSYGHVGIYVTISYVYCQSSIKVHIELAFYFHDSLIEQV